jgi:hypothetical protein
MIALSVQTSVQRAAPERQTAFIKELRPTCRIDADWFVLWLDDIE